MRVPLCVIILLFAGCQHSNPECSGPVLAPNQPNGSSPLASAMVAMDVQLQAISNAAESESWEGLSLPLTELLQLEPTDASMINSHFVEQAPLYQLAIEQFNAHPSPHSFNAVVDACANCHLGTCPGPLERIEKRRVSDGSH